MSPEKWDERDGQGSLPCAVHTLASRNETHICTRKVIAGSDRCREENNRVMGQTVASPGVVRGGRSEELVFQERAGVRDERADRGAFRAEEEQVQRQVMRNQLRV